MNNDTSPGSLMHNNVPIPKPEPTFWQRLFHLHDWQRMGVLSSGAGRVTTLRCRTCPKIKEVRG